MARLLVVGAPGLDRFYRPDRNNFAPRVGLAYDVSGTGRTVIRAGFSMLYETLLQANSVQQVENNPPYSAFAVTRTPDPVSRQRTRHHAARSAGSGAAVARHRRCRLLRFPQSRTRCSSTWACSTGSEKRWLLELAYVGSRGLDLPLFLNANQVPIRSLTADQRARIAQAVAAGQDTTPILSTLRPYPAFDAVTLSRNAASSTYHSGQIKIERRFAQGLSVLASYTFSKSIDNASDFGSGDASEQVLDSYNLALERAVSSFDVPHRFSSAFTYEFPFNASSGFVRKLVGGWQVNAIVTLQSGQPFTPSTTTSIRIATRHSTGRMWSAIRTKMFQPGLAFNPAAFRIPALGTFGNAGRNIVRGDGFHSVDLSLFKNFAFTERWKLQFRAEAVNSFNHVNYQGPVVNLNTTPGAFVAAAPPRIIQFGLKLSF